MLTEKIALVTGASRGIGKAIAMELAGRGATVIVNYSGSEEKAQQTVSEIKKNGGEAVAVKCDVADFAACEKLAKDVIGRYGRLDILVNNAGITRDGLIMKMSEQDFDSVMDTNLKGTYNMIRHFSRWFLKQKSGRIINIAYRHSIAEADIQHYHSRIPLGSEIEYPSQLLISLQLHRHNPPADVHPEDREPQLLYLHCSRR